MDSHVMIQAGGINSLIEHMIKFKGTGQLIHGPMLSQGNGNITVSMKPEWGGGMYGRWDSSTLDKYNTHKDINQSFDIEMHGMGLFACETSKWLGFNPAFRGFGGEEGYIHKKFKNQGCRVVCLPSLVWIHRFDRPSGVPYRLKMIDRITNYAIGWKEVGLDLEEMIDHFATLNVKDLETREKLEDYVYSLI